MRHLFRSFPLLITVICGCTLTFDDGGRPLSIRWLTPANSSVSIKPVLTGIFSQPVSDSSTQFEFTPPVPSAYTVISPTRDTFTVHPAAILEGGTRYVIRAAKAITSASGSTLDPADDSLVIVTFPREQEPNDAAAEADTVDTVMCGTLSTTNDTDFFVCTNSCRAVAVASTDVRSSITVYDSLLDSLAASSRDLNDDTITIPAAAGRLFYIRVLPAQRISGGLYQLNIIR